MVTILDAASGEADGPERGPFPTPLLISPDGRRVFSGSQEGKGILADTQTVQANPRLFNQGSALVSPRGFSPDGRQVLTTSQEPSLSVWDTATARLVLPPLPTGGSLRDVAYSADGRRLLTSTVNGKVRIWDASTGQPLTALLQDSRFSRSAIFSPDGRRVLAIGEDPDGHPRLWLWKALPDRRPIDDLTRLVTLMTGRRIDPKFGLMPADPESLREAWEASRQALLHGEDAMRRLRSLADNLWPAPGSSHE
jgi:WD40 repeat protein